MARRTYDQTQQHVQSPQQSPDRLFLTAFEPLLAGRIAHPQRWVWTPLGCLCGLILGFIIANIPGMLLGAYMGYSLGKIRDRKGQSVMDVYMQLPRHQKLDVLKHLAQQVAGLN